MQDIKVKCKFCGKTIRVSNDLGIWKHYNQKHYDILTAKEVAEMIHLIKKSNPLYNIPKHILISYINKCIEGYNREYYETQFASFYKMITVVREMKLSDIDRFFSHVLPWKLSHPSIANSIELCSIIFDNKEEADLLYQKYMLKKNPYYQHGSELSPFSKKHKRYQHLPEEEKKAAVSKFATSVKKEIPLENSPLHIEYYLKQGMTEEEARVALSERQSTFSLEKCIKKYGEEEGKKRWQKRQEKWQKTLNSKSPDEIERINRAKMSFNGFSPISQELFWKIYDLIKNDYQKVYFATLNPKTKEKDNSGTSNEFMVFDPLGGHYFLDFYIPGINKVIEFDGWYWHHGKGANKTRAQIRENALNELGYVIYHVEEFDFKKNPEETIQKCIEFIKS